MRSTLSWSTILRCPTPIAASCVAIGLPNPPSPTMHTLLLMRRVWDSSPNPFITIWRA